jgi:hypothetical protein
VGRLHSLALELRRLGLRSLVLFGSWARGSQLAESDVDVIVVAEGFDGLPFYEREYLVLKVWRGTEPLEPWCYTPREAWKGVFERPRLDLIDALEHGVVVYDDGFWRSLRSKYIERRPYGVMEAEGGYRYLKLNEN